MPQPTKVGKWTRVVGPERDALRTQVHRMYVEDKMSVRAISEAVERSYGATHLLLEEAGVTFRPRGNPKVSQSSR